MNINIELGKENDIDEIEQLYNDLNDHLAKGVNYPGWKKGIYPVRQNAIDGVNDKNLFTAKLNGKIVGTFILNHEHLPEFDKVKWACGADWPNVFILYTFVVHPDHSGCGIGKAMIDFSFEYCKKANAKSIRLDVYEENTPAIRLYEKCGFKYVDTVDLGLGQYGLNWFRLYEKLL